MFMIDPMSRQPVYEQIIRQMERFILSGMLVPGDQLPSVRSLSMEPVSYTHLDVYKRQVYPFLRHRRRFSVPRYNPGPHYKS